MHESLLLNFTPTTSKMKLNTPPIPVVPPLRNPTTSFLRSTTSTSSTLPLENSSQEEVTISSLLDEMQQAWQDIMQVHHNGNETVETNEQFWNRMLEVLDSSSSLGTRIREIGQNTEAPLQIANVMQEIISTCVDLSLKDNRLGSVQREVALSALALVVDLTDPEEFTTDQVNEDTVVELRVPDALLVKGVVQAVFSLALIELEEKNKSVIQKSIQLLDNLNELFPSATADVAAKTPEILTVLLFILEKANQSEAEIALAASETLAVLLNNDDDSVRLINAFSNQERMNSLVCTLLRWQIVEPDSLIESEWCENTHDILCRIMVGPNSAAQDAFRNANGIEACMGTRGFSFPCALKTLDFALQNSRENCRKFVDCGGLGVVFPALMGRSLDFPARSASESASKKRKRVSDASKDLEQNALSIVSSLSLWLPSKQNADIVRFKRLCTKLMENNKEKLFKVVETARHFQTREFVPSSLFTKSVENNNGEEENAQVYLDLLGEGLDQLEWALLILASVILHGPQEAAQASRSAITTEEWAQACRVLLTKAALGCEAPSESVSLEAKGRIAELVESLQSV